MLIILHLAEQITNGSTGFATDKCNRFITFNIESEIIREVIFSTCLNRDTLQFGIFYYIDFRKTSYINIPAATDALSDSALPGIGILTRQSAAIAASSLIPFASLPIIIATL